MVSTTAFCCLSNFMVSWLISCWIVFWSILASLFVSSVIFKVVAPGGFVNCFSVRARVYLFACGAVFCVLFYPSGADDRRASEAMRGGGERLVIYRM